MTSITLEHVSKRFEQGSGTEQGRVQAVNNISLKIPSGDILAILGPSGSGKSTLLRLVAGILKPDSGSILYNDLPLEDVPLRERGIGMVFQEGALMPHWEARRSVGFFLNLRKREEEVPERLRQVSSITGFGLDELMGRKPRQLSGGEQQRVGIARALARDLSILLFDEPFANLDAKYRTEARVELKRLLNAFPVTSIYVTHDQIEAVALAQRIAVMRDGHIEQIGSYASLRDNPVNLFIATFIGTPIINLFQGKVQDGLWQGAHFGGYDIRRDLANDTRVTLGIRPERVRLGQGSITGIIDQVVPYFTERYQLVSVAQERELWHVTTPLDQSLQVGQAVTCEFDPASILYFDTRTGQRIG